MSEMLNSAVVLTNAMNSSTVFYEEKGENDLLNNQHTKKNNTKQNKKTISTACQGHMLIK